MQSKHVAIHFFQSTSALQMMKRIIHCGPDVGFCSYVTFHGIQFVVCVHLHKMIFDLQNGSRVIRCGQKEVFRNGCHKVGIDFVI